MSSIRRIGTIAANQAAQLRDGSPRTVGSSDSEQAQAAQIRRTVPDFGLAKSDSLYNAPQPVRDALEGAISGRGPVSSARPRDNPRDNFIRSLVARFNKLAVAIVCRESLNALSAERRLSEERMREAEERCELLNDVLADFSDSLIRQHSPQVFEQGLDYLAKVYEQTEFVECEDGQLIPPPEIRAKIDERLPQLPAHQATISAIDLVKRLEKRHNKLVVAIALHEREPDIEGADGRVSRSAINVLEETCKSLSYSFSKFENAFCERFGQQAFNRLAPMFLAMYEEGSFTLSGGHMMPNRQSQERIETHASSVVDGFRQSNAGFLERLKGKQGMSVLGCMPHRESWCELIAVLKAAGIDDETLASVAEESEELVLTRVSGLVARSLNIIGIEQIFSEIDYVVDQLNLALISGNTKDIFQRLRSQQEASNTLDLLFAKRADAGREGGTEADIVSHPLRNEAVPEDERSSHVSNVLGAAPEPGEGTSSDSSHRGGILGKRKRDDET